MPDTGDQWTALDSQHERLVDPASPAAEARPMTEELPVATPSSFAVGSTFKRSMPGVDQAADVFEFRR